MTCPNPACTLHTVCQRKDNPPAGCTAPRTRIVRNGYATMAMEEQRMRMSAIEFRGDF